MEKCGEFSGRRKREPRGLLPEIKPSLKEFLAPSGGLKAIWFGHSSFLLNIDGVIVLVDPVFSGSAAPVSFAVKRFQDPVLSLSELPKIDYILISHDHYDHLDMNSIKFFKDKKEVKFVTPLGIGAHLEGWGISKERVFERDWWQEVQFEGITFIATPAQHFSGRGLFDRNCTQWASWIVQSKTTKFILAGTPAMTSTSKKLEKSMALTLLFWKADNTTKSGVKFICYQKRQLKPIKT